MTNRLIWKYIGSVIIATILFHNTNAQVTDFYNQSASDSSLVEGFSLHGSSLIYFRNNEYFSGAYPGFTALGANNELSGNYRHGQHSVSAGIMYRFAFGQPMRHQLLPVLTYRYGLAKDLNVVMGTLSGPAEHKLPQELLGMDRYLYHPLEYGLQFTYKPGWMDADVWIDWRNNIVQGDSAQEQFTQGSRFIFHLLDKAGWKLDVNAILLFYHNGGQIDRSDAPVMTRINNSIGMSLSRQAGRWNYMIASQYFGFRNDDDFTAFPWKKGDAYSISLQADNSKLFFGAAYKNFHHFFALHGDQVFSILNQYESKIYGESRRMITGFARIQLMDVKNFRMGFGAELYYDLGSRRTDYNYSVMGRFLF